MGKRRIHIKIIIREHIGQAMRIARISPTLKLNTLIKHINSRTRPAHSNIKRSQMRRNRQPQIFDLLLAEIVISLQLVLELNPLQLTNQRINTRRAIPIKKVGLHQRRHKPSITPANRSQGNKKRRTIAARRIYKNSLPFHSTNSIA